MSEEKLLMFRNRLMKVFRHLRKLAKRQGVSSYRIYDHDIPEFPFCIEIYDDKLYLAEYKRYHGMTEDEHEAWREECIPIISEVLEIPTANIYSRERRRKAGRKGQYEKLGTEQQFFIVNENGLKFKINLTDYLDTGLFLDHRITRGMVKAEAREKQVLNLFCYTGSFSVYAAAGGASGIISVDLSKTYLNWAEENMQINELGGSGDFRFVQADVKQWLDNAPEDFFDLVVMDPPTFSNSKRMKDFLDVQRDHVELLNKTFKSMRSGGILYFSTNLRSFQLDSSNITASAIKDITKPTTAFDFQGKLLRKCYRMVK
jgi:23S rRNA (cytosine1962-C5)-methyltransferase